MKYQIYPLDNQLPLCTIVCTVTVQWTYDKFIFIVLFTAPESEWQMVLVEIEKILCNNSLIHLFVIWYVSACNWPPLEQYFIQINKTLSVLFLVTIYVLHNVVQVFNKYAQQLLNPSVISHIVAWETLSHN